MAAIAVGGAVLAAGTSDDAIDSGAIAAAQPIRFDVDASVWGVGLSFRSTYPEDRQLTGGGIRIGDDVKEGMVFWSGKYEEQDAPDPFPVAAGAQVQIGTRLAPNCDASDAVPVLIVESQVSEGTTHSDSYRPLNEDAYLAAVDAYCHLDPEVHVAASSQSPGGDFTVTLRIMNPTGESVRVVSEPFRDKNTTWEPASTSVPPRDDGELVLRGHGQGCSSVNPWTTGHVTVNGIAPPMSEYLSEQC